METQTKIFHIVEGGPEHLRGTDFTLDHPYIAVYPRYEGKHARDLKPGETCKGRYWDSVYTVLRFK